MKTIGSVRILRDIATCSYSDTLETRTGITPRLVERGHEGLFLEFDLTGRDDPVAVHEFKKVVFDYPFVRSVVARKEG